MPTIKGWLKPPTSPAQFVCRGRLHVLTQHYIPALKQSAACVAPLPCCLCKAGYSIQQICAVPVSPPESEVVWLLRILASNGPLIAELQLAGENLVGRIVKLTPPEWQGTGSRDRPPLLLVQLAGKVPTSAAPVQNYLAAIGKRTYDLMQRRIAETPHTLQE